MQQSFATNLKVGIFFVLTISLAAVAVVLLGGASSVFEDRYKLYVEFPDVAGLRAGASVRLAGIVVGEVTSIEFPDSTDDKLIDIELAMSTKYADRVRLDSVARIETEGMLGDKYISISIGSSDKEVLAAGSLLPAEQSTSMVEYQQRATELLNNAEITTRRIAAMLGSDEEAEVASVARVLTSVEELMGQAESGDGILNALLYDTRITNGVKRTVNSLSSSADSIASIANEISTGDGLVTEMIYGDAGVDLANEVRSLTESLTGLVTQIESEESLLHALVYDPEAAEIVAEIQQAVSGVKALVDGIQDGEGTIGLLAQDPALYEEMRSLFGGAQRNTLLRNYIRRTIEQAEDEDGEPWGGDTP